MEEQALVIALVGVLGIGAQWLAWRTGWPAIVLMLAAGFLAGPIFGIFNPSSLWRSAGADGRNRCGADTV